MRGVYSGSGLRLVMLLALGRGRDIGGFGWKAVADEELLSCSVFK